VIRCGLSGGVSGGIISGDFEALDLHRAREDVHTLQIEKRAPKDRDRRRRSFEDFGEEIDSQEGGLKTIRQEGRKGVSSSAGWRPLVDCLGQEEESLQSDGSQEESPQSEERAESQRRKQASSPRAQEARKTPRITVGGAAFDSHKSSGRQQASQESEGQRRKQARSPRAEKRKHRKQGRISIDDAEALRAEAFAHRRRGRRHFEAPTH
jgi:hypothetical protein